MGWYRAHGHGLLAGDGQHHRPALHLQPHLNQNSTINNYVVKAKSATATTEAMTQLDAYLAGCSPERDGVQQTGDYYVYSDNSSAQEHAEPEHDAGPGAGRPSPASPCWWAASAS
ncbi:MAG: hypothetical protein V8S34_01695 [Lawsonibacter sp.]